MALVVRRLLSERFAEPLHVLHGVAEQIHARRGVSVRGEGSEEED